MTDIKQRLRCKYSTGKIMENGEPETGWRDFSGFAIVNLPTKIMLEAADHIAAQEKRIAELERIEFVAVPLGQSKVFAEQEACISDMHANIAELELANQTLQLIGLTEVTRIRELEAQITAPANAIDRSGVICGADFMAKTLNIEMNEWPKEGVRIGDPVVFRIMKVAK